MNLSTTSNVRKAFLKGFLLLAIALLLNLWGGNAFAQSAMVMADVEETSTNQVVEKAPQAEETVSIKHSAEQHKLSLKFDAPAENITTVQISDSKGHIKYLDHLSMDSKRAVDISTEGWIADTYEVILSAGSHQSAEFIQVQ